VALASAAGVAIDNARLHERVQELALLHDRERIARDCTTRLIQRLFATGLGLQGLSRVVRDVTVADRIQAAVDDLDATFGRSAASSSSCSPMSAERPDAGFACSRLPPR